MSGSYVYNEQTGSYDYVPDSGSTDTSTTPPAADPTALTPDNPRYVAPVIAGDTSATPATDTASPDLQGALALYYAQNPHTTASVNQPGSAAAAANADGAVSNGTQVPGVAGAPDQGPGVFNKIMQGLGLQNKAGETDYSDPKVMDRILKAVAIGGSILTTLQGPQNKKTASELSAQFKNPYDTWSAPVQKSADAYFNSPYKRRGQQAASSMETPIVAGRRYAEGGGVENGHADPDFESKGPLSLVRGMDSGQADTVKANLSHGEYVFDADTVAALGDGNNEAGARILDKWREELRREKRSAPPNQIPPKAKAPSHYLGKAK